MSGGKLDYFLLGGLAGLVVGAVLQGMFASLAQVLFGWPFIVLAILALVARIVLKRTAWVLV